MTLKSRRRNITKTMAIGSGLMDQLIESEHNREIATRNEQNVGAPKFTFHYLFFTD
jgi:hypothetical protein